MADAIKGVVSAIREDVKEVAGMLAGSAEDASKKGGEMAERAQRKVDEATAPEPATAGAGEHGAARPAESGGPTLSERASGAAAAATDAVGHAAGAVQGTVQGTADRVSEAYKRGAEESREQTAEPILEASQHHHELSQHASQQAQGPLSGAALGSQQGPRASGLAVLGSQHAPPSGHATPGSQAAPASGAAGQAMNKPREEDMPPKDLTSNTEAMLHSGAGLSS